MEVRTKVSLRTLNTMGVESVAAAYTEIESRRELDTLARVCSPEQLFILGGGSNVLLQSKLNKLVLQNQLLGFRIDERRGNQAIVAAAGGENWHSFVLWTLEQGYGGLENLSLIPGSVGAAPIQNIGAYGVELQDVFYDLEAIDLATGKWHRFTAEECAFGYRNSFFKQGGKGRYFITEVRFKLTTQTHKLVTDYGALDSKLNEMGIRNPNPCDISQAVIAIRESKLPDPMDLGNAGSFFKNPVLSRSRFRRLQAFHPEVTYYEVGDDRFKVPAGWLIEECGWKGKRLGPVGCYENQALVIVNHKPTTTGEEVWAFAQKVKASVKEKFGINLEEEVNLEGQPIAMAQ